MVSAVEKITKTNVLNIFEFLNLAASFLIVLKVEDQCWPTLLFTAQVSQLLLNEI